MKHLPLDSVDMALARDHLYKVTTLKEVFNDISCENVLDCVTRYDFYINNIRFYKIVLN